MLFAASRGGGAVREGQRVREGVARAQGRW